MKLEICANSFESALVAQEAGADRIELCTELNVGGLTPSYGLLEKVLSEVSLPVHILIRPRSGNFTYSDAEIEIMLRDIVLCKKLGAAGIVSGVLRPDFSVDPAQTQKLIKTSDAMEFTFHRAFDWCTDPFKELKTLVDLGVTRLLSSGLEPIAEEGIELLLALQKRAKSSLEIMPGGGINETNAAIFKAYGFQSIHCSASEKTQTLRHPPKVPMQGTDPEGTMSLSSLSRIKKILQLLS